jgi:hypothetical protein
MAHAVALDIDIASIARRRYVTGHVFWPVEVVADMRHELEFRRRLVRQPVFDSVDPSAASVNLEKKLPVNNFHTTSEHLKSPGDE